MQPGSCGAEAPDTGPRRDPRPGGPRLRPARCRCWEKNRLDSQTFPHNKHGSGPIRSAQGSVAEAVRGSPRTGSPRWHKSTGHGPGDTACQRMERLERMARPSLAPLCGEFETHSGAASVGVATGHPASPYPVIACSHFASKSSLLALCGHAEIHTHAALPGCDGKTRLNAKRGGPDPTPACPEAGPRTFLRLAHRTWRAKARRCRILLGLPMSGPGSSEGLQRADYGISTRRSARAQIRVRCLPSPPAALRSGRTGNSAWPERRDERQLFSESHIPCCCAPCLAETLPCMVGKSKTGSNPVGGAMFFAFWTNPNPRADDRLCRLRFRSMNSRKLPCGRLGGEIGSNTNPVRELR